MARKSIIYPNPKGSKKSSWGYIFDFQNLTQTSNKKKGIIIDYLKEQRVPMETSALFVFILGINNLLFSTCIGFNFGDRNWRAFS